MLPPPTTGPLPSPRHRRLQLLRDRFIAANLRSRALRLVKVTRSGAFELGRLQGVAPAALAEVLAGLGRQSVSVVVACHTASTPEAQSISDDVAALAGAVRLDEQLTGACDLAVGWPMLEGVAVDGTWLRGPLLLYPAVLTTTASGKRQWLLRADAEPLLNAPLSQAIDRACGVRIDLDALRGGDDDGVFACDSGTLSHLATTLQGAGLVVDDVPAMPDGLVPVPLEARPVASREALPVGRFRLAHTPMLGRFPRAGSTIAADYDALLASALHDADLGAAAGLLAIDDHPELVSAPSSSSSSSLATSAIPSTTSVADILGSRRLQVLPSDKSQDAVFAFLDHDVETALVVQGPPGTGKSQLLANLVVAAAGQGQRVLVVCQKRAALDVVFDRLAGCGFGQPLALVHDVEHDRARVTAAIAAVLEPLLAAPASAPSGAASAALVPSAEHDERGHRLQGVQQAWHSLMTSPVPGRPPLAVLQERRLVGIDGNRAPDELDLSDVVDDDLDEARLRAQRTRLEAVWPMAAPFAAPHPLSLRGDWHGLSLSSTPPASSSSLAAAVATIDQAARASRDLAGHTGPVTIAEALAVADAIDGADAVLGVLDDGGPARDALLVFWGWTGGQARGGVWSTATKRLQKARKHLHPVSLALFSTTAAEVVRWSAQLDELERLQPHVWRVCVPRFWRLRKTMAEVFAAADDGTATALVPADPTGPAAIRAARALITQASAWHALLADLPDHDVLALGIDGTMASIELALSSLQVRYDQVAALHRLHKAVAGPRQPRPLQHPLELGADDDDGFVGAAVSARRALGLYRTARAALEAAMPLVDARAGRLWAEAFSVGDVSWVPVLTALASAAGAGVPSAAALAVRAIDVELASDTESLRAALKRLPGSEPLLSTTAASSHFGRAVETAWMARCLNGRDATVLEAPLVDDGALQRLRSVQGRCQASAAALAMNVVTGRLAAVAHSQQGGRQLKRLLAEVKKKRRQPTVRALAEGYWEHGLSQALPVWLCSPESAASLFPPTAGLFDLVIFDEASQCPVEAAIPALVRARRAIVAGDDQQMPPSHFFQAGPKDSEDDDNDDAILASQSVLELGRAAWPHLTLAWHYRSRDERLIAFSNAAFYGGKLTTAPRVAVPAEDAASDGLHFSRVDGRWQNQQNRAEAIAVVDRVAAVLQQPAPPSIGVVAFNQRQAELIETLLDERIETDVALQQAIAADRRRVAVEQLFIRNLENVQGDERDVIIVSPAWGPDDGGTLAARFGPLGQLGGEKRLNVAITRARRGLHVLCSFNPDHLDVERATHAGPRLFKAWLQAVCAAANENDDGLRRALADAARLGGGHGVVDVAGGMGTSAVGSVVLEQLATELVARGLRVQRAWGLGRQRLDLAVGAAGGRLTVGVDVSGFLSEPDALARDVYAPAFWSRAGWRVLRVTPRAWAADPEKVIAVVVAAVGGR